MLYCKVERIPGAGLGTQLFPWARCRVYSYVNQVPMIAPRWTQARIGPLLRGGIDLGAYARQILLLGLFTSEPSHVKGMKKLWLSRGATKLSEETDFEEAQLLGRDSDVVVSFAGTKDRFYNVTGWNAFLYSSLRRITQTKWLRLAETPPEPFIGINVRCGNDFKVAQSPSDYHTKGPIKTPLDWYTATLENARRELGENIPALVVSDGTREQLASLLAMDSVTFVRPGCAISDLLLLARSTIFLAAGASSFSAWASFLGEMPTLSHVGQSLGWFGLGQGTNQFVSVYDPLVSSDTTLMNMHSSLIGTHFSSQIDPLSFLHDE